jgi:hypothetical protein
MLRRSQIGLSQANVTPKLIEEYSTDIEDGNHSHYQVSPIPVGLLGLHISPCQLIQASDAISFACGAILEGGASPAHAIEWE